MHLLAVQPGDISDGSEAVDLGQSGGDIVVLSAADTDLASLATACAALPADFPEIRLANFLQLQHNLSVDLYIENVVETARLVCVRLLGGARYWSYGLAEVQRVCAERGVPLAVVPGDDRRDEELEKLSSIRGEEYGRLWQYLVQGGVRNATSFLRYAAALIGEEEAGAGWLEPAPIPDAGLHWPGISRASISDIKTRWQAGAPVALVTFYRALVQSAMTAPVDALIEALQREGINPLPVFVQSLKNEFSSSLLSSLIGGDAPSIVLNMTSFAVSSPGAAHRDSVLEQAGCPVLQVVLSSQNEGKWRTALNGLSARDIAMNVALPEVDGRIISRAVAFKAQTHFDQRTQNPVVGFKAVPDRIAFVAELARRWCRLRRTPASERRIAIVLGNYPNRDGRIGNGVGLDTPESTMTIFRHLRGQGYRIENLPETGGELMKRIVKGPTNALEDGNAREGGLAFPVRDYETFFNTLPEDIREAVNGRWGPPSKDPYVSMSSGQPAFMLPVQEFGSVVVGVQPARGYNIDPKSTYHDPDLVPPHYYLAFYAWLRESWGAHAVVHAGKHGTLEWLPGKSVALSESCFPEAVFGPMPCLYPFIVNDPGEGTQAKRRSQAIVIDHMTPPLTRAEIYGPLRHLEALVDEYYEAANIDPRRMLLLKKEILDLTRSSGIDRDCGFDPDWNDDEALNALDNYLCELKEMQIRDGLHIFGVSPTGKQRDDTLVALVRTPRGAGKGGDASILRALAADMSLGFDPLNCVLGASYEGPRLPELAARGEGAWRSNGDTVERLEELASALISCGIACPEEWKRTAEVLKGLQSDIAPALAACGERELAGLTAGLDGCFVEPGPSGAPTRGRPEVLPTGRNFYSVDTRAVPTQTAWTLGWNSAQLLVEDFRQRHGRWPEAMAVSAWGTANMRTGGDDIAQALALAGTRPRWEMTSGRVIGFEILPLAKLGRPRVDVTFRVSGFFRDAFPDQIDLLDSAMRAVMALEEEEEDNPAAARYRRECEELKSAGEADDEAGRRAGFRVFGSKPGAYGAGLQALLDSGAWEDRSELAEAYLEWGAYAYGAGAEGRGDREGFERRLRSVEAVVQNQDNREHDLLDSDDYYQFEGGLASAVQHLRGEEPLLYHTDHSRPETPRIRILRDEIGRVVRARAANPKWIASVMRHGYKGAFELAATVDYLFAFAASTGAVSDHHFDVLFDAYLGDKSVRDFMRDNNPDALREMAERFDEALRRGLWKATRNSAPSVLDALIGGKEP